MSGPRSALEELRTEDLACVSDQVLEQDFGELQKASEALEAERLRRLAEIHRRSAYRRDGYLSTSAWLVDRFGVSQATGQVRMARALDEMPSVRGALASGEISCSAVRVLVAAREAHPQRFADQEGILLDAARTLSVRQLQIAAAYWKQAADSENAAALRDQRRLHASKTLFGMLRVDGELDPETGETVLTALRAVQDSSARAESGPDPRSPAQRRADALGEICRRWLDSAPRPEVAGERPHVTVTIDLEALSGKPGAVSELDHVGPIHPETARRLACDASVSRIITRGKSEPLDVAGGPRWCPPPSAGRSWPGTATAGFWGAIVPPVVRCAPRRALGRRRRHPADESPAVVPPASSSGARGRRLSGRCMRRAPQVLQRRRNTSPRQISAVK